MRSNAAIKADLDQLGRDIDRLEQDIMRGLSPVERRAWERRRLTTDAMRRVRVK